ncbi:Rossmann-fold NAD(P)-binding domain-containing protein [Synechococcus sp. LTW-G]
MKEALILGSTKGIGRAFYEVATSLGYNALPAGRDLFDTLRDTSEFSTQNIAAEISAHVYDLVILNTGGLPVLDFSEESPVGDISLYKDAINSYFLSYVELFTHLRVTHNAKLIMVSSHVIHNTESRLAHSAIARSACEIFLASLPRILDKPQLETLSLRFGPVATDRLTSLLVNDHKSLDDLASKLPRRHVANIEDVKKLAVFLLSGGTTLIGSTYLNIDVGIQISKQLGFTD